MIIGARRRRVAGGALLAAALSAGTLLSASPAQAHPDIVFTSAIAQQDPSGSVTVTWDTSGTDPALTGFRVEQRVSGLAPVNLPDVGPTATSTVDPLTGVSTGIHTVTYHITALGAVPPASIDTQDLTIYVGLPGPVNGVNIDTMANQVTLTWQPPLINLPLLTSYQLVRTAPGAPVTLGPFPPSTHTFTDTVPGLSTGIHEVDYVLTCRGSGGDGGSQSFPVTVYINVPSFPETVSARMGFDGTSGVVTWTPPTEFANLVTGYRIVRTFDGVDTTIGTVGPSVREIVDPTLPPAAQNGDQVVYTVTSLWSGGDGGFQPGFLTVERTAVTMPTPTLTPHNSYLSVAWAAPQTHGAPVTSYSVRYRRVGAPDWISVPAANVDSTGRMATIWGLVNGVHYEIQVAANDVPGAGQSLWSASAIGVPVGPILPITGSGTPLRLAGVGLLLVAAGAVLVRRRPLITRPA